MIKQFHATLAGFATLFNRDINSLIVVWSDIYYTRKKFRGKVDAVKFVKELNSVAERYAMRQPITPLPWTKSDNNGFPLCLRQFKSWLRSDQDFDVVIALSVMRTCELLMLPISQDISTVTESSTADSNAIKSVIDFIPKWTKKFRQLSLPEMKYHVTVKNGPNGHALHTSDSDISAVIRSPLLFRAIQIVQDKLNDKHPMEVTLKDIVSRQGATHSKLTQFPEKAGKTRTIAVVDYYSQRCLKPLHEGIMHKLKYMVSDGTFSHDNVGTYAKQKTKEKSSINCFDLSAATDRFPREIQKALLNELIKDRDLANSLWTILAERTFRVAWSGEEVTYNCGQPMGAYSSWPLFALAHHLLVEYSAYKTGTKQIKLKYRLIGDDVIITDQRVADYYAKLITTLGVEINLAKTVSSPIDAQFSCAEVAKQIYLNGRNLTPLTPGFMRDVKKPYMFNTCLEVLYRRYRFMDTITPSVIIENLFPKKNAFKKTWLLASDPYNGFIKPGDTGYDKYSPWVTKDIVMAIQIKAMLLLPKLQEQAYNLRNNLGSTGTTTDSNRDESRAVPYVVKHIEEQLEETERTLQPKQGLGTIGEILDSFSYMPDPTTPFMDRKTMRNKRLASFKETCFNKCPRATTNTSWRYNVTEQAL